jgi:hypothetical protein
MSILTYGEIMDGGNSMFTVISELEDSRLIVKFKGVVRVDNPYKHLSCYLKDMQVKLPELKISQAVIDFTDLQYCSSNGFYVLMDIIEVIYDYFPGKIIIKRLFNDDWQQETLPILINIDDNLIKQRTTFENIEEVI